MHYASTASDACHQAGAKHRFAAICDAALSCARTLAYLRLEFELAAGFGVEKRLKKADEQLSAAQSRIGVRG
jgi:hypothetical protein